MRDMRQMSATRTTVDSPKNIVPTALKSQFAGDAILNLRITTSIQSGTFPTPLSFPVVVFGVTAYQSQYQEILKNIPAGYNLNVYLTQGDLVFNYSNAGGDSVNFTITSSTMKYASLLYATTVNFMRFNTIRAVVSPAAAADIQFSENFETFQKSVFGGVKSNSIDVDINKTPDQNQTNIVDIVSPITIDSERGILLNMSTDTTSYILNCATSQYSKSTFNV